MAGATPNSIHGKQTHGQQSLDSQRHTCMQLLSSTAERSGQGIGSDCTLHHVTQMVMRLTAPKYGLRRTGMDSTSLIRWP